METEDARAIRHEPVLLREVIEGLNVRPGRDYLDLTLGGGGHAAAVLGTNAPDGRLIGVDRDMEALRRAGERLKVHGDRVQLHYGSLGRVREVLAEVSLRSVDGALIDCGLSSDQLDDPDRGFAFSADGPLDMRMDRTQALTARKWLEQATEPEIADVLFHFGEERHSRRIARAIVEARKYGNLETTADLREVVVGALPGAARAQKIHPATRTFQAIRIRVNDELNELKGALSALLEWLPGGARLVVITFHSLEDRIAKVAFREAGRVGRVRVLTKKPLFPSRAETLRNPRARSARLRAVELIGGAG